MENRAKKIGSGDWADLRALYLPETPETILGLATLSNFIQWNEVETPIRNQNIYSLNGDWSDGTFVLIDRYHLYNDTLNKSNDRLYILLSMFDYSKGVVANHIRTKCYPAILEVFKRNNLELEFDSTLLLYYLPKELASSLEITLSYGFGSRSLTDSDVVIVNNSWPYNHPGSLFYLQRLARLNKSCGIFTEDGNELVSSGLETQMGPVGIVYTDSKYRKCGFGTFVVKSLFKQIAESGYGGTACVLESNLESRAIFEKMGCQIIDEVHFVTLYCDWTDESDFKKMRYLARK